MNETMIVGSVQAVEPLSGSVAPEQGLTGSLSGVAGISGSVVADAHLSGNLSAEAHLSGGITTTESMVGNLSAAYTTLGEVYSDEYDVIPKVDKQLLKTRHKYMTDDVRVHAIPYFEVGNMVGGNTVYIAGEIEIK